MNRRNFLGAMLAAASAPAIVKAENLMKIVVPKKEIVFYDPYMDHFLRHVSLARKQIFAKHMDQQVLVSENLRDQQSSIVFVDELPYFKHRRAIVNSGLLN